MGVATVCGLSATKLSIAARTNETNPNFPHLLALIYCDDRKTNVMTGVVLEDWQ